MTNDEVKEIIIKAFDIVTKVLEQGFVLDKIRAEIEALTDGAKPERIWNVDALEIIDKYRAEK